MYLPVRRSTRLRPPPSRGPRAAAMIGEPRAHPGRWTGATIEPLAGRMSARARFASRNWAARGGGGGPSSSHNSFDSRPGAAQIRPERGPMPLRPRYFGARQPITHARRRLLCKITWCVRLVIWRPAGAPGARRWTSKMICRPSAWGAGQKSINLPRFSLMILARRPSEKASGARTRGIKTRPSAPTRAQTFAPPSGG